MRIILISLVATCVFGQDKPEMAKKSITEIQKEYFKKALSVSSVNTDYRNSMTDNQKKTEAALNQLVAELNAVKKELAAACKEDKKELSEDTMECVVPKNPEEKK